uniref:Uncharacterized protein n=1 Tax=Aureoumbra lagunensis TaxID=44058 RepID=A0A7S3NNU4_9STRA|mmetsp:Transcript_10851/g.13548  ORF Transcript_10851/g.13548 Transcript_10851/m.13548 type:complete len:256 (+) Transcript_10851:33-800(+)
MSSSNDEEESSRASSTDVSEDSSTEEAVSDEEKEDISGVTQKDDGIPKEEEVDAESEVALVRELCEGMDATFARLLLRFPRRQKKAGGSAMRRRLPGDDHFEDQNDNNIWPDEGGKKNDYFDKEQNSSSNKQDEANSRLTEFHRITQTMARLVGEDNPESDRSTFSFEIQNQFEHLAAQAVAALANKPDQTQVVPRWDATNPHHVVAAARFLLDIDNNNDLNSSYISAREQLQLLDSGRRLSHLEAFLPPSASVI